MIIVAVTSRELLILYCQRDLQPHITWTAFRRTSACPSLIHHPTFSCSQGMLHTHARTHLREATNTDAQVLLVRNCELIVNNQERVGGGIWRAVTCACAAPLVETGGHRQGVREAWGGDTGGSQAPN